MTQKFKNYSLQVFKITFAVSLMYWMLSKGNLDLKLLEGVLNPLLILIGYIILIAMITINHWRWWILLNARNFDVTFLKSLTLTYIGLFFNFAMPGSVGGDVVKGYYICRHHPERKMDAAFTILMDRVIGIFAMLSLAIIGILLSWREVQQNLIIQNLFWLMTVLFFGVLFLFVFFLYQNDQARWLQKVSQIHVFGVSFLLRVLKAFQAYRHRLKSLFIAFVLSLLSQFLAISLFMYIGAELGEHLGFETYLFAVALGFISSAIPLSPGGVGVGQVAFYFFFKTYTGQDLQVGTIGITLQQAGMFSLGLVGGLLYLIKGKPPSRVEEPSL